MASGAASSTGAGVLPMCSEAMPRVPRRRLVLVLGVSIRHAGALGASSAGATPSRFETNGIAAAAAASEPSAAPSALAERSTGPGRSDSSADSSSFRCVSRAEDPAAEWCRAADAVDGRRGAAGAAGAADAGAIDARWLVGEGSCTAHVGGCTDGTAASNEQTFSMVTYREPALRAVHPWSRASMAYPLRA
eukprot:4016622-Prymnesium_polylepis.3